MGDFWKQYKSPLWQKKRLELFETHDYSCENCGDSESTLHAHHKAYIQGRKVWEYEVCELMCLCEGCHEEEHNIINKIKAEMVLGGYYKQELLGFICCDEKQINSYDEAVGALKSLGFYPTERLVEFFLRHCQSKEELRDIFCDSLRDVYKKISEATDSIFEVAVGKMSSQEDGFDEH